jgi:hypothetical protein
VEVGIVFTVDAALQHTCASFRAQAERGEITDAECGLLVDGAILLAMHLEALAQDARAGQSPDWLEPGQAGRHASLPGNRSAA